MPRRQWGRTRSPRHRSSSGPRVDGLGRRVPRHRRGGRSTAVRAGAGGPSAAGPRLRPARIRRRRRPRRRRGDDGVVYARSAHPLDAPSPRRAGVLEATRVGPARFLEVGRRRRRRARVPQVRGERRRPAFVGSEVSARRDMGEYLLPGILRGNGVVSLPRGCRSSVRRSSGLHILRESEDGDVAGTRQRRRGTLPGALPRRDVGRGYADVQGGHMLGARVRHHVDERIYVVVRDTIRSDVRVRRVRHREPLGGAPQTTCSVSISCT